MIGDGADEDTDSDETSDEGLLEVVFLDYAEAVRQLRPSSKGLHATK